MALEYASKELRADRDIVLQAVRRSGLALQHAVAKLRDDRGIVIAAVSVDGCALAYASRELRDDPCIVREAVRQSGWALKHAGANLRADRGIVIEAVRVDAGALVFASAALRTDFEVQEAAGLTKPYPSVKRRRVDVGTATPELLAPQNRPSVSGLREKMKTSPPHATIRPWQPGLSSA